MSGQHRSPPPTLRPGWRWHTVAALAGLGILAPPVTLWAEAVGADASSAARSSVSTVTRAERSDAGPLVIPTIGASGAWSPPEETRTAQRPSTVTATPVRTRRPASTVQAATGALVATTTPPQPTVTPSPQPVSTTTADAPPPTTAAATTTSSATPTGEPAVSTPTVTPTMSPVTVTVDVPAGVTG